MKKPPLTYTDLYPSFPWLVWEIVIGQGLTMQEAADRAGIDQGTISKWLHNRTRDPEAPHLRQFARAFRLDASGLISVLERDRMRRFLSQAIPMPPLNELRRGPRPSPRSIRSLRRIKRGLVCVVAAVLLLGGGSMGAAEAYLTDLLLIGSSRRIWRRWLTILGTWPSGISPTRPQNLQGLQAYASLA